MLEHFDQIIATGALSSGSVVEPVPPMERLQSSAQQS